MIKNDYCLENNNTLRTKTIADEFCGFETADDLASYFENVDYLAGRYMVLGGGSNILFTKNYNGTIFHSINKSVHIVNNVDGECLVRAYAGFEWDDFVSYTVNNNLIGLEALSLIPGSVGAAPVQNIGAYGTEVSDYIHSVECYDALTKRTVVLKQIDCDFSYRHSIFKEKSELFVVSVVFKLYKSERSHYQFLNKTKLSTLDYFKYTKKLIELGMKSFRFGVHTKWRLKMNFENLRGVLGLPVVPSRLKRKVVVFIRKRNMPNPSVVANVGCFFKSPIVQKRMLAELDLDPSVAIYEHDEKSVKVSAGDLIKYCGLSGEIVNGVGLDPDRPLILINYDNATGEEIFDFSLHVSKTVFQNTGVAIEPEVVIV